MIKLIGVTYRAVSPVLVKTPGGEEFVYPPFLCGETVAGTSDKPGNTVSLTWKHYTDSPLGLDYYLSICFLALKMPDYKLDLFCFDPIILKERKSDIIGYTGVYTYNDQHLRLEMGETEVYDQFKASLQEIGNTYDYVEQRKGSSS